MLTGNVSGYNINLSIGNVTDNDADTDTENGTELINGIDFDREYIDSEFKNVKLMVGNNLQ